ncbi:Aminoglycoside phosphotransferase [Pyrenophora tritici-repentis]|nr:Aminoglycoside phosphotransferase [Pyrenophora tritici-repentis]KAF7449491.1 Aminoglycoside phosphotransferase [Pyrenophora tritici-repentis]KAI0581713.1 Aminoglycoside phosphotransferase [Pyrenophora tritici-repentis]KAI0585745.1 Aminoglycoside phosphotransferase [Pyrenophora tritici-repentis]KAI0614975.1 Aminoglycoside phosphotransferase [Pyrenophora tritici-repentis]
MEKAKGVPLSQVWDAMPLPQKLQVLLALVQIQKRWLSISFSHYGGLYYASDVRSPSAGHYIEDGTVARDSDQYHKIADAILPGNKTICAPYLWHDDLHGDNIFVDPNNPGKITAIIDWQSCHISPLFNHNADPAFLDWEGLEPENLDLTPKPDLAGLSSEEKSAALRDYAHLNVFIAWRKLMQGKNPIFYKAAVPKDIIIWAIVLSIQDV